MCKYALHSLIILTAMSTTASAADVFNGSSVASTVKNSCTDANFNSATYNAIRTVNRDWQSPGMTFDQVIQTMRCKYDSSLTARKSEKDKPDNEKYNYTWRSGDSSKTIVISFYAKPGNPHYGQAVVKVSQGF